MATRALATFAPRDARAVSCGTRRVFALTRRRSIAARARSLASRCASGCVSGACRGSQPGRGIRSRRNRSFGAASTGCTGDGRTTLIFSFSRDSATWRRCRRPRPGFRPTYWLVSGLTGALARLRVGLCAGFFRRLFDHRRPFRSIPLHDGLLGDSPRPDAGGREIADLAVVRPIGIGFGFRLCQLPWACRRYGGGDGASAPGLVTM